MTNPQLRKAITRTNMYNFWEKILPEKFKNLSKPYSMLPGGVMVVACKNPVVAQELSLHKVMIMNKFSPYMKSVNIKLTDLRFDPKKWVSVNN